MSKSDVADRLEPLTRRYYTEFRRCTDCGHEFEAVQSFSDDPISICPSCGGAVKKRFGNVGISFKGSGFYITDYRSEGYKDAAKKGEAKADSSPASTDSKPAAAAASASESKPKSDPKPAATKKSDAKKT